MTDNLNSNEVKRIIEDDAPNLIPNGSIVPAKISAKGEPDGQSLVSLDGVGVWGAASSGVSDHGALTGLADDDHTQYHNDTRGDARYYQLSTDLATQAELDAHMGDVTAAHAASAISVSSTTLVGTGTDVQAVFEEVDNAIVAVETSVSNHLADTSDAHDASAISYAGGTGISATDVEGAIDELATEKLDTTSAASTYQPLDADLTTIAGLAATTDSFMQAKAGAWASRTVAQVVADLTTGGLAPLASPTFTGTPSLPTAATAVTQAENDASTKLSTTAYVDRATGNSSSNRPACKLYGPTPTTCNDATNTPITAWSSESFDTDNMHSAVTNTGRITINTPGTYIVHAKAYFSSDTAANTSGYTTILVNGTTAHYLSTMPVRTVDSGLDNIFDQTVVLQLAAGDYLEMHVYQNNAVNTSETLQSGATQTTFSAAWVGGTGAAWGNAAVRATSAAASYANGAFISFNAASPNTGSEWVVGSPTRLTCVVPGVYDITGHIPFTATTGGAYRRVHIVKNGSVTLCQNTARSAAAWEMEITANAISMVAGDYVELQVGHDVGSATAINPCDFAMVRQGYQTNPADLPGTYVASMYAANSGAPTHTSSGGWQKVGSGGGTLTWTSEIDKRPSGVSAQVDTATNKRIDIRKTGLYRVGYSVGFSALADGKTFSPAVYKNGALIIEHNQRVGSAGTPISNGSRIVSLTSGDYLELYAWQDDSASEAYYVANSSDTFLQAEYLGPAS